MITFILLAKEESFLLLCFLSLNLLSNLAICFQSDYIFLNVLIFISATGFGSTIIFGVKLIVKQKISKFIVLNGVIFGWILTLATFYQFVWFIQNWRIVHAIITITSLCIFIIWYVQRKKYDK